MPGMVHHVVTRIGTSVLGLVLQHVRRWLASRLPYLFSHPSQALILGPVMLSMQVDVAVLLVKHWHRLLHTQTLQELVRHLLCLKPWRRLVPTTHSRSVLLQQPVLVLALGPTSMLELLVGQPWCLKTFC